MKDESIKTTMWINKKHHKAIKLLAIKEGKPMRALIDEFIEEGLKNRNVEL